jgi:hypothetical protein
VSEDKGANMATIQDISDDIAEVEMLAIRFAKLQVEHSQRSDAAGVAVSLTAFKQWGVKPPASFTTYVKEPAGKQGAI